MSSTPYIRNSNFTSKRREPFTQQHGVTRPKDPTPPTPPLLEPQIFEHAFKPHLRDSLKSHLIGNYTVQPYFHNRLPLSTYFIGQVNDPKCVYSTAQADDSTLGSIILQSI